MARCQDIWKLTFWVTSELRGPHPVLSLAWGITAPTVRGRLVGEVGAVGPVSHVLLPCLSRMLKCWAAWIQRQFASSSPSLGPKPQAACSPCSPPPCRLWCLQPRNWTTSEWTLSRRTPAWTRTWTRTALRRTPSQTAAQRPSHSRISQTIPSLEVKKPHHLSCSVRIVSTAKKRSADSDTDALSFGLSVQSVSVDLT